jgi:hypothetical protein
MIGTSVTFMDQIGRGGMLVIVGGGPIGLEMAVLAVKEGMEVFFCSYAVVPMLGCGASDDGIRGSLPKPPRSTTIKHDMHPGYIWCI